MKKRYVIGGIVVGLLVIGAIAGGGDKGGSAPAPGGTAAPPVKVTAGELSTAFHTNEARAKLAYEGKTLEVSGKVKDIDLSLGDTPVIVLRGAGDAYGMGVDANGKLTDVHVYGLSKEAAAAIDKGQKLTVTCTGVDEVMGSPQVNDCALQQ